MEKNVFEKNNPMVSEHAEKKYFVDARFGNSILQYGAIITALLIVPLGVLFSFISLLPRHKSMPAELFGIMLAVLSLVLFAAAIFFVILRKYWIFTAVVSETGISVISVLRKIDARWADVLSVNVLSTKTFFGGKMIEVKTRVGNFFFPLTMKDRSQEYPKLDLLGERWVSSDELKKTISIENCSLYAAIKERSSKG